MKLRSARLGLAWLGLGGWRKGKERPKRGFMFVFMIEERKEKGLPLQTPMPMPQGTNPIGREGGERRRKSQCIITYLLPIYYHTSNFQRNDVRQQPGPVSSKLRFLLFILSFIYVRTCALPCLALPCLTLKGFLLLSYKYSKECLYLTSSRPTALQPHSPTCFPFSSLRFASLRFVDHGCMYV